MDSDWNHDDEKYDEVPGHVLLLLGHEVGHEDPGDNVDLVRGADEDERRQQDVHHGVVGN